MIRETMARALTIVTLAREIKSVGWRRLGIPKRPVREEEEDVVGLEGSGESKTARRSVSCANAEGVDRDPEDDEEGIGEVAVDASLSNDTPLLHVREATALERACRGSMTGRRDYKFGRVALCSPISVPRFRVHCTTRLVLPSWCASLLSRPDTPKTI